MRSKQTVWVSLQVATDKILVTTFFYFFTKKTELTVSWIQFNKAKNIFVILSMFYYYHWIWTTNSTGITTLANFKNVKGRTNPNAVCRTSNSNSLFYVFKKFDVKYLIHQVAIKQFTFHQTLIWDLLRFCNFVIFFRSKFSDFSLD
jgi:hypothetical protein